MAVLAPPASVRTSVLTDIGHVWWRETLTIVRDPFSLIFSLLQPLVFLGLFGPLLAGLAGDGALFGGSSLQWFLPGVVVMITMFGTSMTGANLQFEIMTGAFERILATPLSRASLMIGRALKELTPLVVQAAIITLVAIPFGFVLHPPHVVVGLLILGVFGVGVGALSYALAIAARKSEWIFWAVQQALLFPLLILSGMMLPLETGPDRAGCRSSPGSTRSPTSSTPSASCSPARSTTCGSCGSGRGAGHRGDRPVGGHPLDPQGDHLNPASDALRRRRCTSRDRRPTAPTLRETRPT